MRQHVRVFTALIALATISACNNSSSPSSNNVTGDWNGTIQYTVNGTAGQQNVSVKLQQTGTMVSGTYSANSTGYFSGGNMAVQGTAMGSFAGTFSFSPSSNPNHCSGTFDVSGPSSGNSVSWSSTGFTSTCGSFAPTSVTLNLSR